MFPHHFFYLFFFLSRDSKLLTNQLNFLPHPTILSTLFLSDSVRLPHIVSTLPKDLTLFLFGLCELRHCGHNTQKIISPADQNLPVLTANDKITRWLRPQIPNRKSNFDFLRNDIRITKMIWKSYHKNWYNVRIKLLIERGYSWINHLSKLKKKLSIFLNWH